jgi:4-hydroxy-3-methylbut-2-enyl diphosphate reductase IspH
MKVLLANPRGFCAGVDRAIEIVEKALELIGPPIYVRHEVVHNRFVVDSLRERGARLSSSPPMALHNGSSRRLKNAASRSSMQPARS